MGTKENNNRYAMKLKRRYHGLPWKATLMVGVEAYKTALKATYQDSGQFAYNWWMFVGYKPEPKAYTDMYYRSPVGARGDKRGYGHRAVVQYNLGYYGIDSSSFGGQGTRFLRETEGSLARSVTITNPLYDEKYGMYPVRAGMWDMDSEMERTLDFAENRIQRMIDRGKL